MKTLLLIAAGFIAGTAFTLVTAWKIFPSLMFEIKESKYDYRETVDLIEKSSEDHGWAVAKIWDLGDRIGRAGYDDAPHAKVLELCHAENLYEVLKNEEDMYLSVLMPCRIAVYELNNGKVFISRMNIGLMSKFFSPNVKKIMGGVAEDDEKILKAVTE